MKYYPLKDLCTDIIDCPHSTPEWQTDGYRVVRNFNLKDGNIDFSDGYFVNEKTYRERIKRAKPETGDIIISREAPVGVVGIVPDGLECCLGQRLVLLKVNKTKCDPYYLLFTLLSDFVQTQFKRADATGSTVSNLCIPDLKEIIIPVNEINQLDIARLFKNINCKIVNNNKINDNLQQQLKALYDYWFVQFDFPDENGNPYRASGGAMVWNETLKKEIPVGWEVKTLSQLIQKNNTVFDFSTEQPAIDLSVMPSDSMVLPKLNSSTNFTTNLYLMKKSDILIGSIRPYLHKAGFAPCNGVVAGTVHSYHVVNAADFNFVLFSVCRDAFFDYAVNESTGTKMPVVSSNSILDYKLPYSSTVAHKFNNISFTDIISNNICEIQELTQLRDWLLPMLMNGQAAISD